MRQQPEPSSYAGFHLDATHNYYYEPCEVLPLDEFNGLKSFIHISNGEVEAKVEHSVTGGLLTVLHAHKIS